VVKHLNQTWSDGLARGSTGPCFPLRPAVHCSPHQSHVLPPKPGAPHATSTRVTGSREPAPFYPPEDHRKSAHEPEHASTPTPSHAPCLPSCRTPDDRSNRVTRARAAAASPFPGERSKPKRPRQASAARAPSVPPSLSLVPRDGNVRPLVDRCPSSQRLIHRTPLPPHRLPRCSQLASHHSCHSTHPLQFLQSRASSLLTRF
jgi:hypothetical protein